LATLPFCWKGGRRKGRVEGEWRKKSIHGRKEGRMGGDQCLKERGMEDCKEGVALPGKILQFHGSVEVGWKKMGKERDVERGGEGKKLSHHKFLDLLQCKLTS
jgi:hypothetical protein